MSFEYLLSNSAKVHGHLCAGQVLGVRMSILGLKLLGYDAPLNDVDIKKVIVYIEIDRCAADAIATTTGVKLGRRSLKFMDYGLMAATFLDLTNDKAVRLTVAHGAREKAYEYAPEQPDQAARELIAYQKMPAQVLFQAEWVEVRIAEEDIPGHSNFKEKCENCQEKISFKREVEVEGRTLCQNCAGHGYFKPLEQVTVLPDDLDIKHKTDRHPPVVQKIKTTEAVGMIAAHDMTEIIPGKFKGPAFKKGHVIKEEDLPQLFRMGKNNIYVLEPQPGWLHEDEAALILATALAGVGITFSPNPSEGKISLKAAIPGLLKVKKDILTEFNMVEGIICASRHDNTLLFKDRILAGTRTLPLIIEEEKVRKAAEIASRAGGVFSIKTLAKLKIGLVITGEEVFSGLKEDRFLPVLKPKLEALGQTVLSNIYTPDDPEKISEAIHLTIEQGAQLIIVTGGLSVDPDDATAAGIEKAGATDILHGVPVLPGNMSLLAEVDGLPIVGVPACGIFNEITALDLILPRLLTGEKLTRKDLAEMSHGGFCLSCVECTYPKCPFGK